MASTGNIKSELQSFIDVRSDDSPLSHLKQIFLFKNEGKVCGSFNGSKIKIWVSSTPIIGVCYPVIQLNIDESMSKVTMKSRMNQIGLGLAVLINLGLIWASLNLFILNEDVNRETVLKRVIVSFVLVLIFNAPIYFSYKVARDVLMKKLEDLLKKTK